MKELNDQARPLEEIAEEAIALFPNKPEEILARTEQIQKMADVAGDERTWNRMAHLRLNTWSLLGRDEEFQRETERTLPRYEQTGYLVGQAAIFNGLSILHGRHGRYLDAIQAGEQALAISRETDRHDSTAQILGNLGSDYVYLGNYERGLECLQESLQIWQSEKDQSGIGFSLLNLANCYSELNQDEQAEACLTRAYQHFVEAGLKFAQVTALENMARHQAAAGNLTEALETANQAVHLGEELNDELRLGHALDRRGQILSELNRVKEARADFDQALKNYRSLQNSRGEANVLSHIASHCPDSQEQAIALLQKALELAEKTGIKGLLPSIHQRLARAYEAVSDWTAVLKHLKAYHDLDKEMISQRAAATAEATRLYLKLSEAHEQIETAQQQTEKLQSALGTARKQKREARTESRLKSDILRMAAHDLGNMSGVVVSYIDILRLSLDGVPLPKTAANAVDSAFQAASNLNKALQHMIDGDAIENGAISINAKNVPLRPFISRLCDSWRAEATKREIRIIAPNLPELAPYCDPVRLEQILQNLLSNSVKYSTRNSSVTISAEASAGRCLIRVTDHGPGIDEDVRQRIFQPFNRGQRRAANGERSIGLGLYIARRLAEAQNGSLELESSSDSGSVFLLSLPLDEPARKRKGN